MSNNFGIGTKTPQEKLHIEGGILLGDAVNENNGTICFNGIDILGRVGDPAQWKSLTGLGLKGEKGDPGPRGPTGLQGGDSNWPKNDDGRLYYPLNVSIGIEGTTSDGKLYVKADDIDSLAIKVFGKSSLDGDLTITGTLKKFDVNGGNDLIDQIVTNKSGVATNVSGIATNTSDLDFKANLDEPTFTGTVTGVDLTLTGTLKKTTVLGGADLIDQIVTNKIGLDNRYTKTQADAITDILAPLANPELTGNPTAPTQLEGDNSTNIATTAYVKIAVDAIPEGVLTESNSVATYDGGLTLGTGNESAADGTIRVKDGNLEFRIGGVWEKIALLSQFSEYIPLYTFSSHTFTNCYNTGSTGPSMTQCRNTYSTTWDDNNSFFEVILAGYQRWTVPVNGNYSIRAKGASDGWLKGQGADITSTFFLFKGDRYMILIGQMGTKGTGTGNWYASGGGGGTFMVKGTTHSGVTISDVLIVAGGGGGSSASYNEVTVEGGDALNSSSNSTGGGSSIDPPNGGGAGSGLIGNGSYNGARSSSFINDGYGSDITGDYGSDGGFGGGGAGGGNPGGGGGGIYGGDYGDKGVGGSGSDYNRGGQGGGSHVNSNGKNTTYHGSSNKDHGSLTITLL